MARVSQAFLCAHAATAFVPGWQRLPVGRFLPDVVRRVAKSLAPSTYAMLSIRHRRDFAACARDGARARSHAFLLQARLRHAGEDSTARLGLTATKRGLSKLATQRNRARRRLREAARIALAPEARKGYDYVLVARPLALTRSWNALLADLRRALARTHAATFAKTNPF